MANERYRKTVIGLVLEEMSADFSKELIESVLGAMPSDGSVRLMVLGGKYDGELYGEPSRDSTNLHYYNYVCNSVYELGGLCRIDGLIIHLGSMDSERREELDSGLLRRFGDIPKVFICSDRQDQITVNYDNESGIREAVEYLVNVNGLTKICMLGGRDDNLDSVKRRKIFIESLTENGIDFDESAYEPSNMSRHCEEDAGRLLDRNIPVQAVFCVNDAEAGGLYEAMRKRGKVPGKDILVFGFDNTHYASEIIPSLTSIGAAEVTLGQKALELILKKIRGEEVKSALVPTRLYGRESFDYGKPDYSFAELIKGNDAFIYRMFDDCFYRYKSETRDRSAVDLRRLFFEIVSGMLTAMKRRYMSMEDFDEMMRMVDIFLEKGVMDYTDAERFIRSIEILQINMNKAQRAASCNIVFINRLFLRMKDKAVCAISDQRIREKRNFLAGREAVCDFLIDGVAYDRTENENIECIIRNIGRLGIENAAFYMFGEPVVCDLSGKSGEMRFPENIDLCCVIRSGEFCYVHEDHRRCLIKDIFLRDELSSKCKGYAVYAVNYREQIYGFLLCELTDEMIGRGEYIALNLGRTLYLNSMDHVTRKNAD